MLPAAPMHEVQRSGELMQLMLERERYRGNRPGKTLGSSLPSGKNTNRHRPLGSNLISDRSSGRVSSGNIDTKLATRLAAHTRQDRNTRAAEEEAAALRRLRAE